MAGIVLGALVPHPPVLVPEVGGEAAERVRRTADALEEVAGRVASSAADCVVVVTPHGPVQREEVCLYTGERLAGDFGEFGAPGIGVTVDVDEELTEAVARELAAAGLPLRRVRPRRLDHGALVPLSFLDRCGALRPCVILTPPWATPRRAAPYGAALRRAAESADRAVVLLASGDLSHRLSPGAPAGYAPEGPLFDEHLVRLLREGDPEEILDFPADLAARAGQDVLPGLGVLLGALEGSRTEVRVLSYEGPFGVGYAVALWCPGSPGDASAASAPADAEGESAPVTAARRALFLLLAEGEADPARLARRIAAERPALAERSPELLGPARGVFVSLKSRGRLRGCMGTLTPTRSTLLEEIAANAVAAATADPRFHPLREEELPDLAVSVDVLEPPEPVASLEELDPEYYGIVVSQGRRRGLLLPDLEGVETPLQQYLLACRKAGIAPGGEGVRVERFRTRRFT